MAPSVAEMEERRACGRLGPVKHGKDGWPRWDEARSAMLTVVQEPGETLFVPSNWFHEVENLTDCISVRRAATRRSRADKSQLV